MSGNDFGNQNMISHDVFFFIFLIENQEISFPSLYIFGQDGPIFLGRVIQS